MEAWLSRHGDRGREVRGKTVKIMKNSIHEKAFEVGAEFNRNVTKYEDYMSKFTIINSVEKFAKIKDN